MKGERECAGKRWRQTAVFLCCYFERLAAALLPWSGPAYFCPGLVLLLFLAPKREKERERERAVRKSNRERKRETDWESFLYRGWEAGTELTFSPVTSPNWSTWWTSAGTARRKHRRHPETAEPLCKRETDQRRGSWDAETEVWSSSYAADHLWSWLQHHCRVEEEKPGHTRRCHRVRYNTWTHAYLHEQHNLRCFS